MASTVPSKSRDDSTVTGCGFWAWRLPEKPVSPVNKIAIKRIAVNLNFLVFITIGFLIKHDLNSLMN
jgi:hypothetical protein